MEIGIDEKFTLDLGSLKDKEDIRRRLADFNVDISDNAVDHVTLESTESKVELARTSVSKLRPSKRFWRSIFESAERQSLLVCCSEVSVQLWLQYPDVLAHGENLIIATEPVVVQQGWGSGSFFFGLWHLENGDRHISMCTNPSNLWSDRDGDWIFLLSS